MKTDLKYDKYKDYLFEQRKTMPQGYKKFCNDCNIDPYHNQWIFKFPNEYGASIVKHWGSYGFDKDLFELAMIKFTDDNWYIVYTNLTNDDVVGYLNNDEVMEYLERIKNYDK